METHWQGVHHYCWREWWAKEGGLCQPKPQWPLKSKISVAHSTKAWAWRIKNITAVLTGSDKISLALTGGVTLSKEPVLSKDLQSSVQFRMFSPMGAFNNCFKASTPSQFFSYGPNAPWNTAKEEKWDKGQQNCTAVLCLSGSYKTNHQITLDNLLGLQISW